MHGRPLACEQRDEADDQCERASRYVDSKKLGHGYTGVGETAKATPSYEVLSS